MKDEKKYYPYLDIIRIISCLGVLFYHLGYLKGGFLSVCCFFVLSGYLSYISLSRKDTVHLKEYYKNRFFHIYLPLLIVVFLTTCVVSFIPNIHWFQLKPETTSVLFGYNNYWQLSVNSDYFARHISSPFMHFWYIGILLQFELVFPFFFLFLKKCKEHVGKIIPMIFLILLVLGSCIYFYWCSLKPDIMFTYYDTFARSFSLLFGVLLGFIHREYKSLTLPSYKVFFWIYLLIFITLQFIVDSNSSYFAIAMIFTTLISCRLIDYGTKDDSSVKGLNKGISYLSNISYEIYLVQYPIIFLFQYINIPIYIKIFLIIFIVFALSSFIHFSLHFKDEKHKYSRLVFFTFLSVFALYGMIIYVTSLDHTKEMNDLKDQLSQNEQLLEEKQKDYQKRLMEEKNEWNQVMVDLESSEAALQDYVHNLPIIGVGDSVMLGAVPTLYQTFPNGYFDAAVSRTDYEANRILSGIKYQGMLSDHVVIHLGTNGQCGLPCQRQIMSTLEDRKVFYVTVSNDYDVHVNDSFYYLASEYPNITIVDWYNASLGHPEYFASDGIHLTSNGMNAYSQLIYDSIYKIYYDEYQEKKNALLLEHENELNDQVVFYGNDTILNIYDSLQKEYPKAIFQISQEMNSTILSGMIKTDLENQILSRKVVISIDDVESISKEEYLSIISSLKDYEVYLLFVHHKPYSFDDENVHVINFYSLKEKNSQYTMVDGIHLSDTGNKELLKLIQNEVNKKGLEN